MSCLDVASHQVVAGGDSVLLKENVNYDDNAQQVDNNDSKGNIVDWDKFTRRSSITDVKDIETLYNSVSNSSRTLETKYSTLSSCSTLSSASSIDQEVEEEEARATSTGREEKLRRMSELEEEATALIFAKNWRKLRRILLSEFKRLCSDIAQEDCDPRHELLTHYTLLHISCKYQPPLFIVKALIEAGPKAVSKKNEIGQLPLHVAICHGTSSGVVSFLIEKYAVGAGVSDGKGRTPLHLLFSASKNDQEEPLKKTTMEYRKDEYGRDANLSTGAIARLLCQAAPNSITKNDLGGRSALEYALDSRVSERIILELRETIVIQSKFGI